MALNTVQNYFAALRCLRSHTSLNKSANPDVVGPESIPSLQGDRSTERILADVDQDGFLFARSPSDISIFNGRDLFYPRRKHELQVVYAHGRVCLRKRFALPDRDWKTKALEALRLYLLNEAGALRSLEQSGVAPRLIAVDILRRTIDMELIDGLNVRQIVARTERVLDTDAAADPALARLTAREARDRVFAFASRILPADLKHEILRVYSKIHDAGVIQRDLHPANIVIGKRTGKPYVVDFELADLGTASAAAKRNAVELALAECLQVRLSP